MLKMMKYEFRKSRFSYLVLLGILGALEAWFLLANVFKTEDAFIPALLLLVSGLIAFVWVLVSGIVMFDRDLKDRSGLLVYMVPVPAWKILLAKVLTTFAAGTVLFFGFYALGLLDMRLFMHALKGLGDHQAAGVILMMFNSFISTESLKALFLLFVTMIITVFLIVSGAYFADALANTVLRGRKGRGITSVILFFVLIIALNWLAARLFGIVGFNVLLSNQGLTYQVSAESMNIILYSLMKIAAGALLLAGTAELLKKRIDL
jgi:ABC-2 type transport system permease protein